jgi:hypothetical protein
VEDGAVKNIVSYFENLLIEIAWKPHEL